MRLRQLEYFVGVAEELHFTRAAAKLGVSQPVLSSQVKALEAEIGSVLLNRTTQEVSLTPSGESFLIDARLILEYVKEAIQRAHSTRGSHLRVGSYASAWMPLERSIHDSYSKAYPDAEVDVVMLGWQEMGSAIREGRIDAGFMRVPEAGRFPEHKGLVTVRLRVEQRVVALRRDHILAGSDELSINVLAPYPVVAPEGLSNALRDWWICSPRPDGSPVMVARTAASMGELIDAVALTGDIAFGTESVAEVLRRPNVVFSRLVDVDPAVMCLAWAAAPKNPNVRRFVEVAKRVASN